MRLSPAVLTLLLVGAFPHASLAQAPTATVAPTVPAVSDGPVDAARAAQPAADAPISEGEHTGFKTLLRDVVRDFRHLPSKDSAIVLGIGGAATGLVAPWDDDLNERLAGEGSVDAFFKPGKVIGYGAVQIGAAIGTWAIGRAIDKRGRAAHLGLDLLRAQVLTQSLTYGLKYTVRRERPDGTSGYSFPSGHASTTFASATVLERHLGWKAAVPTYIVATYVAASRLHENRHYLSDVVFGGTLGLVCGRTVTRHGRSNYALIPLTAPGGLGVAFTRIAS